MFLIVGLGNPGKRYRMTRHNLGFMVVDHLAVCEKSKFKKGKGPYEIAECEVESKQILLAKPTTYMNRSGHAVAELFRRFPVTTSHLLVVCDDLNLPLGRLRLRKSGSDGGHNGLASIIDSLGSKAFPRLRLGIGTSSDTDAIDYVLSPFISEERPFIDDMIERGSRAVMDFVQNGIEWAMNVYNGKS